MASITFKGSPVKTAGALPAPGSKAPGFSLTRTDLAEVKLDDFKGKKVVLNIFPSVDTGICAASVKKFNQEASSLNNTVVLCISKDLPFAHSRFCEAEGLKNVVALSEFKDHAFSTAYGVTMADGPLAGLMSRAVVVLDTAGTVVYAEQVPEIAQEPDYQAAVQSLKQS